MRALTAIVALLALPVGNQTAFAHPGGLNAEGCHNNRKTGEYHCHRSTGPRQQQAPSASRQSLYAQPKQSGAYRNCTEARAAGAAPVYRGEPGYGPHLDRDGDGIGCEPYRGR